MKNKDYFDTPAEANKYIRERLRVVKDFLTAEKTNRVLWLERRDSEPDRELEIVSIDLRRIMMFKKPNAYEEREQRLHEYYPQDTSHYPPDLQIPMDVSSYDEDTAYIREDEDEWDYSPTNCKLIRKEVDKHLHFELYTLEKKV